MRGFRTAYGRGPLHLLGLLASFAIAGYAVLELAQRGKLLSLALWFVGAIALHDLVLFPLYSFLDRALQARRARRVTTARAERVPGAVNHLRVPAAISGVMLLVWFPVILGLSAATYRANVGYTTGGYLGRWLVLTAALFALSGLVYAVRRVWAGSGGAVRGGPRSDR